MIVSLIVFRCLCVAQARLDEAAKRESDVAVQHEARLQQLTAELHGRDSELATVRTQLEALQSEHASLTRHMQSLDERSNQFDTQQHAEADALRRQVADLSAQAQVAREESNASSAALTQCQSQLELAQDKIQKIVARYKALQVCGYCLGASRRRAGTHTAVEKDFYCVCKNHW
jgi:predicted  nucleic acid-binding Zn-ribbon protein